MESMPEELSAEEVVRYQFEAMSQAAAAELEAVGNSEGASAWRGYSGRLLELIQESPLEEGASLDAWRGKIMQRAMRTMITSVFVSVLLVGFTGTVVGWGSPAPFSAEPKCAGQPKGTECWMALASHPECYFWNPNLQPDETVTWTAECSGGLAQGMGTLTWVLGSGKRVDKGLLQDGKRHDRWVFRWADGIVWNEETYVNGELQ